MITADLHNDGCATTALKRGLFKWRTLLADSKSLLATSSVDSSTSASASGNAARRRACADAAARSSEPCAGSLPPCAAAGALPLLSSRASFSANWRSRSRACSCKHRHSSACQLCRRSLVTE